MVKLLAVLAGLNGALLTILGAFFIFVSFTRGATYRRVSLSLGSMMVALGVANLLVFYTGGLGLYLVNGGATWVALVALVARIVAGVLLLTVIINSLLAWRQSQKDARKKVGKKLE